jgi:hypothetical protein
MKASQNRCPSSDQEGDEKALDFLDKTFGKWQRKESPDALVANARNAFCKSIERHEKS